MSSCYTHACQEYRNKQVDSELWEKEDKDSVHQKAAIPVVTTLHQASFITKSVTTVELKVASGLSVI